MESERAVASDCIFAKGRRRGAPGRPKMSDEPPKIDAGVVTVPLDKAMTALGNKIEREWPKRYANILGARELVLLTVVLRNQRTQTARWNIVFQRHL
jgi:hypothetical protein